MKKTTLLFAVLFTMSLYAEQTNGIVYVKAGATGAGTSWNDALGDIQTAINVARANKGAYKDVWVGAGNYAVSTCILLSDSVNVYGSFAGTETGTTERAKVAGGKPWQFVNQTILSATNCRLMESSKTFVLSTVVDGFVLTGGTGTGTQLNNSGGAIIIRPNLTLQNSEVKNSSATGNGGGVNMTGGSVLNCHISSNTGALGGGLYSNTTLNVLVDNCLIEYNTATGTNGAGGVRVQGTGTNVVKNSIIRGNKATGLPAGAISSNTATNSFINCIIVNNTGNSNIYLNGGNLINCTVANNVGQVVMASATAVSKLTNNIVWGNKTDAAGTSNTGITSNTGNTAVIITNCGISPALSSGWTQSANFTLEFGNDSQVNDKGPGFVAPTTTFWGAPTTTAQTTELEASNWSIKVTSGAVDKGISNSDTPSADIIGTVRPKGAAYDIGAYEYDPNPGVGIDKTIFSYKCYTRDNQIHIEGLNGGEKVYVFNTLGAKVAETTAGASKVSFNISKGIYLVRVSNQATKVIVK